MGFSSNIIEMWKALGCTNIQILSVLDGRSPLLCSCLDGLIVPLRNIHNYEHEIDGCRCNIVGFSDQPLVVSRPFVMHSKPVKNIPRKDRNGLIGQVPSSIIFIDWFDTCSIEFQKEYLGKLKYNLFKNHSYTLLDFVDLKNMRELDDKEILEKFNFKIKNSNL